jgi:hypothetical protein
MDLSHIPEVVLQAAAYYALEGMSVFPCAAKIPLTGPGGFRNASQDAGQIAKWWTVTPDAQIGLPTGQVNHLFVLDIDGPEGARAAEKLHLPETFTVQTRPGRLQLWFELPEGVKSKCTTAVLGPQLDTRGDGGYVIAPPSRHHSTEKPYTVIKNIPLAIAPAHILEPQKSALSPQPSPGGDAILQGRRHSTMLSIAGALRARHLSPEAVLAQLRITNAQQCQPPLEDSELQKLALYVGSKPAGFRGQKTQETSAEVQMEAFATVTSEKVVWLWDKRIPLGKLTLFVGDPGKGKSLITIDLASRMSRGAPFPDGAGCQLADSIFLSGEDDANDTIRPRLDVAGADVSRVHRVKAVKVILSDGATGEAGFSLERDLEKLEDAVKKIPGTQALLIDPVNAYMGKADTHRDSDVRRILTPLAEFAARLRLAVIGVMHLKKSETSALLRVGGSIGFVAAARVVWGFGEHPDSPELRVMAPIKNNLAPLGYGLSYRIEAAGDVARVVWQPGDITISANDVLSSDRQDGKDHAGPKSKAAETWLLEMLKAGEEVPVSKIIKQAEGAPFSWRTVEQAKKDCGVRAVKRGRSWYWVIA